MYIQIQLCAKFVIMVVIIVLCSNLAQPNNGMINCSLGDDGIPSYEDTCSFTCNTGYELTGSGTTLCQSDGRWSGSATVCRRGAYITTQSHIICMHIH